MQAINKENLADIQKALESFRGEEVYLHLETTSGVYTAYRDKSQLTVGCYIRNGKIRFTTGKITGAGPYRVGLKMDLGWGYAESLTDWEVDGEGRLLLAGHNAEGKLACAFELSRTPFN